MIICKLHFEPCICLNVWIPCYPDNAIDWIVYPASSKFVVHHLNETWHTFVKFIFKVPGSCLVLVFVILQFLKCSQQTFPYYSQLRS